MIFATKRKTQNDTMNTWNAFSQSSKEETRLKSKVFRLERFLNKFSVSSPSPRTIVGGMERGEGQFLRFRLVYKPNSQNINLLLSLEALNSSVIGSA